MRNCNNGFGLVWFESGPPLMCRATAVPLVLPTPQANCCALQVLHSCDLYSLSRKYRKCEWVCPSPWPWQYAHMTIGLFNFCSSRCSLSRTSLIYDIQRLRRRGTLCPILYPASSMYLRPTLRELSLTIIVTFVNALPSPCASSASGHSTRAARCYTTVT